MHGALEDWWDDRPGEDLWDAPAQVPEAPKPEGETADADAEAGDDP